VAVLEMLSEVVRSKEFLGRVALSEFVYLFKMLDALIPVLVCRLSRRITTAQGTRTRDTARSWKLIAAVAADVSFARSVSRFLKSLIVFGES
jgi:hypothetical protein